MITLLEFFGFQFLAYLLVWPLPAMFSFLLLLYVIFRPAGPSFDFNMLKPLLLPTIIGTTIGVMIISLLLALFYANIIRPDDSTLGSDWGIVAVVGAVAYISPIVHFIGMLVGFIFGLRKIRVRNWV